MGGYYIDSKFKSGFPRWERARVNALINPESPAAKLYNSRVETAHKAAKGFPPNRIFAFVYHNPYRSGGRNGEVEFRCCSAFCAALEIQRESAKREALTPAQIASTLNDAFFDNNTRVRVKDPSKPVKCRTCWSVIHPNGEVTDRIDSNPALEELWAKEAEFLKRPQQEPLPLLGVVTPPEPEPEPELELFAITMDGKIQPLSDVAVVRLSSEQYDMLMTYSTDELRWQYGEDHTLHLQGEFVSK